MNEFVFDSARRLAAACLKQFQGHRDVEDLISETVVCAWKASRRHPEIPLPGLVTTSARFTVKKWFSDGRCGDIVGREGKGRVPVFTMPWQRDGDEQVDAEMYDAVSPDFTDALIERLEGPPEDPNEGEIHLTAWERRQKEVAEKRARQVEEFARCRAEEIRHGQELLALPDMLTHYREAIRLRYIEGLSTRKTAEALGMAQCIVQLAARKARKQLEQRND